MKRSDPWITRSLGVLTLINLLLWSIVCYPQSNKLRVYFFDVGQGDAILIVTPSQHTLLIDGGPDSKILGHLGAVLPFFDKTIDAMILTHPHEDHQAGLYHVLQNYLVPLVIERLSWKLDQLESWKKFADKAVIIDPQSMAMIRSGEPSVIINFMIGGDVENSSLNNSSIVTEVSYGSTRFLFMGDIEIEGEKAIIKNKTISSADVLKVGHHGSKTSTSQELLNIIKPHFAIISVGKGNKYNHPAPVSLDRLFSFKTKILRTDELGTIVLESDGEQITIQN